MKLYILRHGDAAANAPGDAERPLTTRGEREVQEISARCAERLKSVELVVSSPYRRARQTAAIMMRTLSTDIPEYPGELLISPQITPAGHLEEVGAFVEALDRDEVLLVSHQPLVGQLLMFLTDSDDHGGLGTANLLALDLSAFTRGGAQLLWLERPE